MLGIQLQAESYQQKQVLSKTAKRNREEQTQRDSITIQKRYLPIETAVAKLKKGVCIKSILVYK